MAIVNGIDAVMHYLDEYKIRFIDNPQGYHALLNTATKCIIIRKESSENDQIKYILHELIHYHPVFLYYTKAKVKQRDESVESQIEKLAQETYNTRPDIVERIKEVIEESRK